MDYQGVAGRYDLGWPEWQWRFALYVDVSEAGDLISICEETSTSPSGQKPYLAGVLVEKRQPKGVANLIELLSD